MKWILNITLAVEVLVALFWTIAMWTETGSSGIAVLGCIYLFFSLPVQTQLWFLVWNVAGLGVYFLYARRHALAS